MTDMEKLIHLIALADFDVINIDHEGLAESIIEAGFKRSEDNKNN